MWLFYAKEDTPPNEAIALDHFYELGTQRIRSLQSLNPITMQDIVMVHVGTKDSRRDFDAKRQLVQQIMQSESLSKKNDVLGHYILRLLFSRPKYADLAYWWIESEGKVLMHRILQDFECNGGFSVSQLEKFTRGGIEIIPCHKKELLSLATQLTATEKQCFLHCNELCQEGLSPCSFYFKVPFAKAARLVGHREVFVHKGEVYLPQQLIGFVMVQEYSSYLAHQLNTFYKSYPSYELPQDDRLDDCLAMIVNSTNLLIEPLQLAKSQHRLQLDEVDDVAETHFPLCMRNLHRNFRLKSHLRYLGRMQYRLFLKGCGFSVQDSLLFWRKGFDKISDAEFRKKYAYNIRHSYGLEGHRKSYQPDTCQAIIQKGKPGAGECHGCPFAMWEDDLLMQDMMAPKNGMGFDDAKQVIDVKKTTKSPTLACLLYLKLSTQSKVAVIDSEHLTPNVWFNLSMACRDRSNPIAMS